VLKKKLLKLRAAFVHSYLQRREENFATISVVAFKLFSDSLSEALLEQGKLGDKVGDGVAEGLRRRVVGRRLKMDTAAM
jgi:hypothetical protein